MFLVGEGVGRIFFLGLVFGTDVLFVLARRVVRAGVLFVVGRLQFLLVALPVVRSRFGAGKTGRYRRFIHEQLRLQFPDVLQFGQRRQFVQALEAEIEIGRASCRER